MKKVIVGIGISGSGKSTLLKNFAEKHDYQYVCPDDIRVELTGDAQDQSKNAQVWQETYRRITRAIARDKIVVVDATFADVSGRKSFLKFLRKVGAEKIQGVYADIDLEIAKQRNLARDRVVPEYVLERMDAQLKKSRPSLEDGFDSLFTFDEFQQLTEANLYREGKNISKKL